MTKSRNHTAEGSGGSLGRQRGLFPVLGQTSDRRTPTSDVLPKASTVALLTGGGDKPYALGLAAALAAAEERIDFIGSDDLEVPELQNDPRVNFLNLRGDQRTHAGAVAKVVRVFRYYLRLVGYAAQAKPKIFHILWNNKFEFLDRTLLMLYYRLLVKRIVLTVHNVNIRARDGGDSRWNRATLKFQYRLCDHIFVHTEEMKGELMADFNVPDYKASVIPFGINNTVPNTGLTPAEARRQVGVGVADKTLLFFGNIAPYKGLEYLVDAFIVLAGKSPEYRLIIAGRPKGSEDYWSRIQRMISSSGVGERIVQRIEYVPDEETELYFKAADVLALPYTHVFQSGVLFLSYSFGMPVIAADVGSLKEEIIEGRTGFVFAAKDSAALARTIETYFSSHLFQNLERHRREIRDYANERYSWTKVSAMTTKVYSDLLED
jgi:glycosyltransferase involved in cell wall biosynthesis